MRAAAPKYFQDPVHGHLAVHDPLLLRLIDSRAVQRLRHVRQLGTGFFTFLGAEHSRFAHSLGAMHLMGVVLDNLAQREGLRLAPAERQAAQAAALLHDIGHFAFSHTLEGVLGGSHEAMSVRLIKEDPELRRILGPRRAAVAAVLQGTGRGRNARLLHALVSSQLDVDRLDYLLRDAYATGVASGHVDLARIYAMFTVHQGVLAVKEKGRLAVEEYFLARYFMYWKVYFHKTSRCFELLLRSVLRRARDLHRAGRLKPEGVSPALQALFSQGGRAPVALFLDHDDSDITVAIKAWAKGGDPLLADLCRRFLTRGKLRMLHEARLPDETLRPGQVQRAREYFERLLPGSADYWFLEDRFGSLPYDSEDPVWLVDAKGVREDLARRSEVIRGVMSRVAHARYYVPHEHAARLAKILGLNPPKQLKLKIPS